MLFLKSYTFYHLLLNAPKRFFKPSGSTLAICELTTEESIPLRKD